MPLRGALLAGNRSAGSNPVLSSLLGILNAVDGKPNIRYLGFALPMQVFTVSGLGPIPANSKQTRRAKSDKYQEPDAVRTVIPAGAFRGPFLNSLKVPEQDRPRWRSG